MRTPLQRLGIVATVFGLLAQLPAFLNSQNFDRYLSNVHYCTVDRYDCSWTTLARVGAWIAGIGAVLWLLYPLLARLTRWVRFG